MMARPSKHPSKALHPKFMSCPTRGPMAPGLFPVSNASLALAIIKLGRGETLETETGAVLEIGGA